MFDRLISSTTPMNLDIAAFQAEINTNLKTFLQKEFLSYQKISSHKEVGGILAHIGNVSAGGKRLRPLLVWSIYKQENKDAKPEDIMSLLLAVELFHIFCLIHDDVMDEASLRHGVPTLQALAHDSLYRNVPQGGQRIADNQAILAGDIVFNSVFKLFTTFVSTQPRISSKLLDVFHLLIDEVCIGQMIDVHLTAQKLVLDADIVEKNRLKTAYYSFARPLHLGVIVAGRSDLLAFVLEFGEQMGLLYQIQDDLLDITGNAHETKKPLFQDIAQNQHTLLSNFVRAQGAEQTAVLECFVGKTLTVEDTITLQELFSSCGAIAYANELIDQSAAGAEALIERHTLSETDGELFRQLLGLILKRKS